MAGGRPIDRTVTEDGTGTAPVRTARVRRTSRLAIGLALVLAMTGFGVTLSGVAAVDSCDPGWYSIQQIDDSFSWVDSPLPLRSASWTGVVQLQEELDADCYVTGVQIDFLGTGVGNLDAVLIGRVFLSYTIQYPDAFEDYTDVASNAHGLPSTGLDLAGDGFGPAVVDVGGDDPSPAPGPDVNVYRFVRATSLAASPRMPWPAR